MKWSKKLKKLQLDVIKTEIAYRKARAKHLEALAKEIGKL